MSTFDQLRAKARHTAIEIGERVEELSDCTTISIKMKNLEMRIEEQYERLGRVVYHELHTDKDLSQKKMEIIAVIDALFDEHEVLKERKKHWEHHDNK